MTTKILFYFLSSVAGIAAAFQGAANSGLSGKIGEGAAILINSVIVLVASVAIYLIKGAHTNFFPPEASWTLYLGGIFGFIIITVAAFVFREIGVAVAVALMVLGQGIAALVIDHFGLMGMAVQPITLMRLAGVALMIAGVVLLRL